MNQDHRADTGNTGGKSATFKGLALAALIVVAVTGILEARVALTGGVEPRNPLTVATVRFSPQDDYSRPVSYLGLVTAAEHPGTRDAITTAAQLARSKR